MTLNIVVRTALAAAILLSCACAGAGPKKGMTLDHMLQLKSVGSVTMSPDGLSVAYVVREPRAADEDKGRAWSSVHVWREGWKNGRRFTRPKSSAHGPSFAPDGSLAFVTARGEEPKSQVWSMPLDGGEATQVTHAKEGVGSYGYSPDGKYLAYVTSDPLDEDREAAKKKGYDQEVARKHPRHRHLTVLNLADGKTQRVTPKDKTVGEFAWAPGSERFAVMLSDMPYSDEDLMFRSLVVFPLAGGEGTPVANKMGKMVQPTWSPDGQTIAWRGASVPNDATNGTIWVAPLGKKPKPPRALNAGANETAYHIEWASNDELLVSAVTGTKSHLSRRPLKKGEAVSVLSDGPVYLDFSIDKARKKFALGGSTAKRPADVFVGELGGGGVKRVTNHHGYLDGVSMADQSTIEWTASDGLKIGGVLLMPLNYVDGQRYPMVLMVHGGPEWQSLDAWGSRYISPAQWFAANGYVVMFPNYRGSAGRGAKYAMADHKDLGGKEFQDIIDGVKHLVELGLVDEKRVGMMGGSYGGYMSALAATKGTETFAAAINFAGIASWWSFTGTSDIPHENSLVHWDLYCYDSQANSEKCWKGSPLAYITQAKTPLMMIHGKEDKRVPVSQSVELFTAFRIRKIPTELVMYPREGHGIAERAHQEDALTRMKAWFDKHLAPK